MKNIILLTFATMLAISCSGDDEINGIRLHRGDTKTYETKDYLIIYEVSGITGLGRTTWEFKKIINKKDSL